MKSFLVWQVELLSHFGSEHFCPLSMVRYHTMTFYYVERIKRPRYSNWFLGKKVPEYKVTSIKGQSVKYNHWFRASLFPTVKLFASMIVWRNFLIDETHCWLCFLVDLLNQNCPFLWCPVWELWYVQRSICYSLRAIGRYRHWVLYDALISTIPCVMSSCLFRLTGGLE